MKHSSFVAHTIWVLAALATQLYMPPAHSHERARSLVIQAHSVSELIAAISRGNSERRGATIILAPGEYHLTDSFSSDFGGSSTPVITGKITILGHKSADTTLTGETGLRLFTVLSTGKLSLKQLTLTNGFAWCDDDSDCEHFGGGAINNIGGLVWIENSVLTGNRSLHVDGNGYASGGAISSIEGYLYLENTSIVGNSTVALGGGISIIDGAATIKRSIISGNGVGGGAYSGGLFQGAGIRLVSSYVEIEGSTISGNRASNDNEDAVLGIGISNQGGTLRLTNSAVTENISPYGGEGAGIFNTGRLIAVNSTIGGNVVGILGGGLYNSGEVDLRSVSIVRNEITGFNLGCLEGSQAPCMPSGCDRYENPEACIYGGGGIWNEPSGVVRIQSSVLAANLPTDCEGTMTSAGHNVVSTRGLCQFAPARQSDQFDVDAKLNDLSDSGEAGNAHYPLQSGSVLIDAGGNVGADCRSFDQLGHRRQRRCDVGAIELRAY